MENPSKNMRSIKLNSIIYAFKLLITIVSPMVTFPYISRTLLVNEVGSVTFCTSIINYFTLISTLGIPSYAVRAGVKYRGDNNKFSEFVSQILSINLCSTIGAYALFLIIFFYSAKWKEYTSLMLIISLTIPMTTLGMEWVFTIYEEYTYITVRSLFIQIIAITYLITMVRNEGDIIEYAIYTVLVNTGANIFNFIRVKKYCKIKLQFSKQLLVHIKPILVLFTSSIACQIYLNSDITMIGYIKGNTSVGLYSAAVKIYNLSKTILSVFITVSAPRLAFYRNTEDLQRYNILLKKVICTLLLFLLPATVGIAILSKSIIVFVCGNVYAPAAKTLKILIWAMPFSILGSCMATCCLLVHGKDLQILYATITGAIVNLVLNFYFIGKWGEIGAAITTFFAEVVTLSIHLLNVHKIIPRMSLKRHTLQCVVAVILMAVVCKQLNCQLRVSLWSILCTTTVGAFIYFLTLLLEKNQLLYETIKGIREKIKNKQKIRKS